MELKQSEIILLKGLVGVLEEYGETISNRMYEILSERYPDVMKVFNRTHIEDGDKKQVKLLHHVLVKSFESIDQPEVLIEMFTRAAEKHSVVMVQPEQYQVVAECLLEAIQDVLGVKSDSKEIQAITKAYQILAGTLIEIEAALYKQAGLNIGEVPQFIKTMVLSKRVVANGIDEVTELTLAMPESYPEVTPMQYLSLHFPKLETTRQYSIVSAEQSKLVLGIKRDTKADSMKSVSNFIYSHLEQGDNVLISLPAGGVNLADLQGDVCVISAGVGVTAHLSLLNYIAQNRAQFKNAYHLKCVKNGGAFLSKPMDEVCRQAEIQCLRFFTAARSEDSYPIDYEYDGHLTNDLFAELLHAPKETHYFLSAPENMTIEIYDHLLSLGVDGSHIHCDFYGPTSIEYYKRRFNTESKKVKVA